MPNESNTARSAQPAARFIPTEDVGIQPHLWKELQQENLRLKCLVAEQALYIRELEELISR